MAYLSSTAEVLDALGDPTRRAVLELLRDGPRAVVDIASELPVSRPAVSQHLRVLKGAGLVTERKDGTRHLYRVDPEGLVALRTYLESFWTDALAAFKDAAERRRHTVIEPIPRTVAVVAPPRMRSASSPRRWARGGPCRRSRSRRTHTEAA